MKEKGIRPNLPIYNDLLKAASMDGLYMEVEAIMDDMLAMGIEPDRQSYHHLIHVRSFLHSRLFSIFNSVLTLRIVKAGVRG